MFKSKKLQASLVLASVLGIAGSIVPAHAALSADTTASLTINAGVLSITAPTTVTLNAISVSSSTTNTTGTTSDVVIQDLRGSNAGWSATATMTNFTGSSDNTKYLLLASATTGGTSRFSLTPGALSVFAGDPGTLDGITDYTTAQTTTSLTALDGTGVSNTFNLASFSTGNGAGKYQKTLGLSLDVPAYTFAQTYTATLTSSVA